MWNAITAFCKAFGPLLIKLSLLSAKLIQPLIDLIDLFFGYFILKKHRIKNAIEAEVDAKKKAKVEQYIKEMANVKAFKLIEQDAWKDRLKTVLRYINAKEYEKVLALLKEIDNDQINLFLFDDDISSEYKAIKIIKIMQKK